MYYERARLGISSSTTEALRSFYESAYGDNETSYALLNNEKTFDNLEELAGFWADVQVQNAERFSDRVLRRLFVLNYAPNGMWAYLVSVYYMQEKDSRGKLDDEKFYQFLNRITAFIWAYAIMSPGVNALRTPAFAEMINIVNGKDVMFDKFKYDIGKVKIAFENFKFLNTRPITRSMLTWWAFNDDNQKLMTIEDKYEIEHIYPKNRQDNEHGLTNKDMLECLGNKALLEKKINIRASDYRLEDKKGYYLGEKPARGYHEETKVYELSSLGRDESKNDFTENDIINRNKKILESFYKYLEDQRLVIE